MLLVKSITELCENDDSSKVESCAANGVCIFSSATSLQISAMAPTSVKKNACLVANVVLPLPALVTCKVKLLAWVGSQLLRNWVVVLYRLWVNDAKYTLSRAVISEALRVPPTP